ncbi:hypothetical protein GCM10009585_02190 [Brevibacterium paucivorans]|uniref:hypothetical protein n=1 Tax=Brevibacterium paucivorans TaxID=170994 RepID=UPI0031D23DCB
MVNKKQIDRISVLAKQLETARAKVFETKQELDQEIQSALAMAADETEIKRAALISDTELTRIKGPALDESVGYKYRCSNTAITRDQLYDVPIDRYKTLREVDWEKYTPGATTRIIIQPAPDVLPIDLLYFPRKSPRLIVAFHGAEDRKVLDAPKFQFTRSLSRRSESLVFVSDSTLLNGPRINLGWVAGNKDIHVGTEIANALNQIILAKGHKETILLGHSGGGFAAMLVGSKIPNSRAISVNGQSVVKRYEPWTVLNLKNEAFPETSSIEEMAEKYANRLDLRVALTNREATSSFTYFGNYTDPVTFGRLPHFPLLAEHFGFDEGGA